MTEAIENARKTLQKFVDWSRFMPGSYQEWGNAAETVLDEIKRLQTELAGCRAFERSVNEALNSGDGSYRP